jgi:hypothetical protein
VAGIEGATKSLDLRLLELQTRANWMKQANKVATDLSQRIDEMKARRKKLEKQQKSLQGINIDPKYTQAKTTPLRHSIEEGTQTLDLVIQP